MVIPFADLVEAARRRQDDEARTAEIVPIERLDRSRTEADDGSEDGPWIA